MTFYATHTRTAARRLAGFVTAAGLASAIVTSAAVASADTATATDTTVSASTPTETQAGTAAAAKIKLKGVVTRRDADVFVTQDANGVATTVGTPAGH